MTATTEVSDNVGAPIVSALLKLNFKIQNTKTYSLALFHMAWLQCCPITKRSWVQCPVRAHAYVAGLIPGPGANGRLPIDASLLHWCFSPSLPLSLKAMKKNALG